MTSIVGLAHYYFYRRLVVKTGLTGPRRWGATAAIAALAVAMPITLMLSRSVAPQGRWLFYLGYGWMGVGFLLLMALGLTDLARLVLRGFEGAPSPERRAFLGRVSALAASAVALSLGAWGAIVAMAPVVRRVQVGLKRLQPAMHGTKIVQLTDVHVGPTIGRDFISGMVRAVNRLNPDVIAITGDLVDGPVSELGVHVAPLADLRAKHGTFFVTGNHEYYSGVAEWVAELGRLGVRVLDNERVAVGEGEHVIDLAGVNDWSARRFDVFKPDLAKALHGRDVARPVVLLAHQPKIIKQAAEARVDLVLSGHTHGGQIWPWTKLVALDQPYLAGLHREEHTQIYVSEGTGYWGPPMRIGTAPEITEIILDRA